MRCNPFEHECCRIFPRLNQYQKTKFLTALRQRHEYIVRECDLVAGDRRPSISALELYVTAVTEGLGLHQLSESLSGKSDIP